MPLIRSYGCLCSWLVPHDQGVFTCVGTGGRFGLYRGKWCADQPCIWHRRWVAGIGAIRVSSTRRLWPPAPGCVCAVEDGLLVASDWLRPVTRGGGAGGGGAGGRAHQSQSTARLMSAN